MLSPLQNPDEVKAYAAAGLTSFAMELVPRITRAQSMDVLSSQANLAGYRAVLEASVAFGRAFPDDDDGGGHYRAGARSRHGRRRRRAASDRSNT